MDKTTFKSDIRWMGVLFALVGGGMFALSFSDPEMPAFFGPLFMIAGVIFGSTKVETTFDIESEVIHWKIWRFFFLLSEDKVDFSAVESISTPRAPQNKNLAVKLKVNDGRNLNLGSFVPGEAKNIALECRRLLRFDERMRQKLDVKSGSIADVDGVQVEERGESIVLKLSGVEGSAGLSVAAALLGLAAFFGLLKLDTHFFLFAFAFLVLLAGVAAVLWRRSRPVKLEVSKVTGVIVHWPSLLGAERQIHPWQAAPSISVEQARTNRRFLGVPVVEIRSSEQSSYFGDGLPLESCHRLALYLNDFRPEIEVDDPADAGSLASSLRRLGFTSPKQELKTAVKYLLLSVVLGSFVLSWCYVPFYEWRGSAIFPVSEVVEKGGGEQVEAATLPGITHVRISQERGRMTMVTPYGVTETVRKWSDGEYHSDYFFLGMLVAMAFPACGWLLAFVGQFLQERRMVKIGVLAFVSVFPVAIVGWLVGLLCVLLGLAFGLL